MTKVLWSIFGTILLAVLGFIFAGSGEPNLEVTYEGAVGQIPIIFLMVQSHEEKPITIKRININSEYEVPLKSQVVLKNGETFSQMYDWTQGPPIRHATVETDRGIVKEDLSGNGYWPAMATIFDAARKTVGSKPVLPPTPTPSPSVFPTSPPAQTANSGSLGTPEPTTAPSDPVNSSNPVVISGSYINQVSGEQGDLVLTVEHFIDTEDGKIAFGGKLKLGPYNTRSVSGCYDPSNAKITFGQGDRTDYRWTGSLNGEEIDGAFTSGNTQQHGIWQAKHSGGLSFDQARKAYGTTPSRPRILPTSTPLPVSSVAAPVLSTPISPVAQSTPIVPIALGPSSPLKDISDPEVNGEYAGQTYSEKSGVTHQVRMIITNGDGTTLGVTLVTTKGTFSGTGEVVKSGKPHLTLHFAGVMTLDGTIEGGVFQGRWHTQSQDNQQVSIGTFQLKKTL